MLTEVRGPLLVRSCRPSDAPSGRQGDAQAIEKGAIADDRDGDLGGDAGQVLLLGEGGEVQVGACLSVGDASSDGLVERATAAATVLVELVAPGNEHECRVGAP